MLKLHNLKIGPSRGRKRERFLSHLIAFTLNNVKFVVFNNIYSLRPILFVLFEKKLSHMMLELHNVKI